MGIETKPPDLGDAGRSSSDHSLSLRLFGGFRAQVEGRPVNVRSRKTCALLAFIALGENQTETRERLVGLCWSESEEGKARASLRQALRELRKSLSAAGFNGLESNKLSVGFDRSRIRVDVWEAVQQTERQGVHSELLNTQRICESLLRGYEDIDPAFRLWLLARRQSLQDRLQRALEAGLAAPHVSATLKDRIAAALANLDPTHEEACRHLMLSKAEAGDIGGSLKLYRALYELLDEEYGMEPSAQTSALVVEIKQGNIGSRAISKPLAPTSRATEVFTPPTAPVGAAPRLILSVEPFYLESVQDEKLHLLHGFRHALIACLVRFREWRVTESQPTSAEAPGDPTAEPKFSLRATAYQSGKQIHIILTLKELSSDQFIWSDRLNLKIETWFELQHRIIRRITMALNVHLSAERLMRVASEPDVSLDLYDRWLRGQAKINNYHPEDWRQATMLFRNVVDEAPAFAPAYSSLVQLGNTAHIAHPGVFRSAVRQEETLTLAKQAAQLDPIDSRAQLSLGWAYAFGQQFEQARLHFDLACDLNDHDAWTLTSAAQASAFLADSARARELGALALESSIMPSRLHWAYHAGIRFFCGDYEGALDAAQRSGDALFNNGAWRAASCFHLGFLDDAKSEADACLQLIRDEWRGPVVPTDEEIASWLLHLFPIRYERDWERLRQGLIGAGVPAHSVRHQVW